MAMAVADAFHKLCHEPLDHILAEAKAADLRSFREGFATPPLANRKSFHVLLQVKIKELKDEVELVSIRVYDVEQANNVRVLHLLQQGDLSDGSTGDTLIFGFQADLLESNNSGWMGKIPSFVDNTICA